MPSSKDQLLKVRAWGAGSVMYIYVNILRSGRNIKVQVQLRAQWMKMVGIEIHILLKIYQTSRALYIGDQWMKMDALSGRKTIGKE